jgi:gliding motility-associatede transport system auxiliary component
MSSAPSSPLDAVARNRQNVAIGLALAGVLFAAVAIWWMVRGWPTSAAPADERPTAKAENEPPKEPEKPKELHSPDYLPAGAWAALIALTCLGAAAYVATRPLPAEQQAATVRSEILVFGGTLGLITAALGAAFAWNWQQSLFQWVNESKTSEAKWVLIAGSVFLAGLILIFASLQLARTEERANAVLRRALYGFNSVFVGLLLLMVLVAINVISFLKVPNTLVTNDSAFLGLAEPSKKFLRSLDTPVHVYLIMPENYVEEINLQGGRMAYTNMYADCRGLLSQCENQSRHFRASYLSPGLDAGKVAAVFDKLKVGDKDREQFGLYIAVGEDENATSFIPSRDMVDLEPTDRGRSVNFVFQGESKLMNELIYLTDARSKEVIYFTQDNDELTMEPSGGDRRSMSGVIQFLRDKKVNVAPLELKENDPRVPADAAAVIVAGPRRTVAPDSPTYKALNEYLKPTTAGAKPGKLIAFLPAFRSVTNKVQPSGLEPLVREFGVEVAADRRLVGVPQQHPVPNVGFVPPDTAWAVGYAETNLSLEKTLSQIDLLFKNARPVQPAQGGPFKVTRILGTIPFRQSRFLRGYWQEEDFGTSAEQAARAMAADPDLRVRKQLSAGSVSVAVAVTEGGSPEPGGAPAKPRMLVFGSDTLLEDRPEFPVIPDEYRHLIFSDCLDWLREREANLGIPPKKESTYRVTKPASLQSLLMLVGIVLTGIATLGIAVWLTRRR